MAFPHQLCQCVTHTLECATLVLQKCLFLVGAVSYPYFWSNASILGRKWHLPPVSQMQNRYCYRQFLLFSTYLFSTSLFQSSNDHMCDL